MKKLLAICLIALSAGFAVSQNISGVTDSVHIQNATPYYSTIAISATAAAGSPAVLTIPAPSTGNFNYVCSLGLTASNNNSTAVLTNVTTSSTNFNSFAIKFSDPGTANTSADWAEHWGTPAGGCVKSAVAGTSTTFTSPTSTSTAYNWVSTYYQAP